MATKRFKVSVGENQLNVTEETGAAVNSDSVELTIELATDEVNVDSSTRAIKKSEILEAIELIKGAILESSTIPS